MKKLHLRAVVLAAGQGTRLRPLSNFIPKPLIPVRGQAVAARTIEELARGGCEAVAVNLFNRGDDIRKALGDEQAGIPITYSQEARLLGTLGALWPLRNFLRRAELVVIINGDSLCRWPIKRLVRQHQRNGAAATLLVSKRVDPGPFGGGITLDRKGNVLSLRSKSPLEKNQRRRVFMGAHVFSPKLLESLQQGPANFVPDFYEPLIASGEVLSTVATNRSWHDLGTPQRYLEGVLSWGRRRGWVSPEAKVAKRVKTSRTVIERATTIEGGGEISTSLILEDAKVGTGCRVRSSIIGPGVELPANTSVEGRLVTLVREEDTPTEGASVQVGGLQYKEL